MAHVGEPSGTLRDFSPWHGPGREDFDGTGDVHRPVRAEPGVPPISNCSTDRGGGRSDLRSPAQKWHKQTRWE